MALYARFPAALNAVAAVRTVFTEVDAVLRRSNEPVVA
jgi:hypothetical protein